jgi:hypothetical protein
MVGSMAGGHWFTPTPGSAFSMFMCGRHLQCQPVRERTSKGCVLLDDTLTRAVRALTATLTMNSVTALMTSLDDTCSPGFNLSNILNPNSILESATP